MNSANRSLPGIAKQLLRSMSSALDNEALIGDFDELYYALVQKKGFIHARIWYWVQVIRTVPTVIVHSLRNTPAMSKNYLKIIVRNFVKNKLFSFINVSGLAIGMVCCVLILLYVQDELSYDRYHENADNIYRVLEILKMADSGEESSSLPIPMGPVLQQEYPHLIKSAVRFFNRQIPSHSLQYENKSFNESRFFFTDSTVFDMFSFPLLRGNPDEALKNPFSIVLTNAMAEKYFGSEDPIGKVLRFESQFDFQVTGIIGAIPLNSHFKFDFLASWSSLPGGIESAGRLNGWYWNPAWTYIQLHDNVTPESLDAQFPAFVERYLPEPIAEHVTIMLQPLTDIHLHSHLDFEIEANSNVTYIYILSGIGMLVLFIACINFMNLTTARSLRRAKEIGIRKVVGARKNQLIKQFLGESAFLSFVAMAAAMLMIELLLPGFNTFTEKNVTYGLISDWQLTMGLLCVALFVGIASGMYPAFFLSGFHPAGVLKGSSSSRTAGGANFRKGLVVMQFAISIVLIIAAATANEQLKYMQTMDLGFEKTGVMLIPRPQSLSYETYISLKNKFLLNANIYNVTAVEGRPGIFNQTAPYNPEGVNGGAQLQLPRLYVEMDFTETFGMEVIAGKSFKEYFTPNKSTSILINEYAARAFGWSNEDAIGKSLRPGASRIVYGVVKDFNFASLHNGMGPFILELMTNPRSFQLFTKFIVVKVNVHNTAAVIQYIEQEWHKVAEGAAFEYQFMDEELNKQYRAEQKLDVFTKLFTSLAVFIACLGLFALASFTAEQKIKEIGIRKVLGAGAATITFSLSKEFTNLALIANLIAFPLGYYLLNIWLQTFAYRVEIDISIFIASGLAAFVLAMLTVSYKSVKAALTDPVKSLRSE